MIGHDLRSPVAALKTHLILLRGSVNDNEQLSLHSRELISVVDAMQLLLDNIFHWSLLQQNTLSSHKMRSNLAEIVEDALHPYEYLINSKKLKLSMQLKPAMITGDEYQLLILIRNLIQNAIKFTPKKGTLRIETGTTNDQSFLLVSDTGIGFPEPVDGLINVNVSQRRGTNGEYGSGMGLNVVHGLAKANNGNMHCKSTPGKGTEVRITFNKALIQHPISVKADQETELQHKPVNPIS